MSTSTDNGEAKTKTKTKAKTKAKTKKSSPLAEHKVPNDVYEAELFRLQTEFVK
jgi:hypothetical protein